MVATTTEQTKPAATKRRRRRTVRRLSRRDKLVMALLLGIPLLLDLAFVWFPALATVLLSFTKWTGVGGIHLKACAKSALPGLPQPGCVYGVQN
jgi:multiple sugar transport system permease protein